MATKIYSLGLVELLSSARHLEEAGLKAVLIDGNGAFNQAHDFYDDISANVVAGTSPIALTNPVVSAATGVLKFDADDTGLTWNGVTDADGILALAIFNDTGTPGTSPLVCWLERTAGLLSTNGSNVTATFNASGIFTLNVA